MQQEPMPQESTPSPQQTLPQPSARQSPPHSEPQAAAHHPHHQRFEDPNDDRNVYIPLEKALETKDGRRRRRARFLIGFLIVAPSLVVLSIALVRNDRDPNEPRWKWMAMAAGATALLGTGMITRPEPKNMPEL